MRPSYRLMVAVFVLAFSLALGDTGPASAEELDPTLIPKYVDPLVIPPAMPRTGKVKVKGSKNIDYYEIAVRQFQQQILPTLDVKGNPLGPTTVWSYASVQFPNTLNYPAFTIESKYSKPARVKWINDLKDPVTGEYLPHILPVDQTLHWANPPGGVAGRDKRPTFLDTPGPYNGPVPIVTHVHGAHTSDDSDGYAEAWYLPAAANIPADYATIGTWYAPFKAKFEAANGQMWTPGSAVFQYPNDQRATTLWYHDHTLGMTRVNVYAGPAGFYIIRGGPSDEVAGVLPGPAPAHGDPPGMTYYEIPIVVQDRMFKTDGSLFYPDTRAFFDGVLGPFIPHTDVSPIWNPEFFGDVMVVNGKSWPVLNVEPKRYRFRLLNGCNSRFLILHMSDLALPVWQIGAEGGFLPAPVQLTHLLIAPAERADVIVDFSDYAPGTEIILHNIGPDEPFGGGIPGMDFPIADPETTGQVMKFVVGPLLTPDTSTPVAQLALPPLVPLGVQSVDRQLALVEEMSEHFEDAPAAALLGTVQDGMPVARMWSEQITENPAVGATEVWEIYNFTADAHPVHLHQVMFQVVDRQPLVLDENGEVALPVQTTGTPVPPEPWETGYKDTVIAYPGQVTRVKSRFDLPGLYVWHCHIVEHEDNEMMRPYFVGPNPP